MDSSLSGRLVVFEGIDNAGKTSLIERLASLPWRGLRVPVTVCRERTSPIGALISDGTLGRISPFSKVYLFAADRAWTYEKECMPALKAGHLVLWDRYVDSAYAYRKAELAISNPEQSFDIDLVMQVNSGFMRPDVTFLIDISVETSVHRETASGKMTPYNPVFLGMVRDNYLAIASKHEYVIVNGERDLNTVTHEVIATLKATFGELFSHETHN